MRLKLLIAIVVLAACAAAGLGYALRPGAGPAAGTDAANPIGPGGTAPPGEKPNATNRPKVGEIVPRASRNVTPRGILPGPKVTGPLIRIAGAPPRPTKPRYKRFYRVMVLNAGTIRAGRTRIHFDNIAAPAFSKFCPLDSGKAWPCGRHARAALRRLIRGRAVECKLENFKPVDDLTAKCRLGATDLAQWLVSGGWAKAAETAEPALKQAEGEARSAKRGLWRTAGAP